MKKLLLLLTLALCAPIAFAQNVPSYVPSDGLVGYWGFNGNADDQSGNGNNGTVNGATLTTDRFGNDNSAYSFNGISNKINFGTSQSLINLSQYTYSVWINRDVNCGNEALVISNYGGNWAGNLLFGKISGNGNSQIRLHKQTTTIASESIMNNNQWINLVAVKDNSSLKLYSNGVLIQDTDISNFASVNNTSFPFVVGGSGWSNWGYFMGKIDDIGVWNRALTQQEITNMYNGVNYSDTCNAVSGSLTQGLVGYWPFCGNANDDSGNGNNGTVNGATLTTDRFGNDNSAYNFNGTSDYIQLNSNIGIVNELTLTAWVKTEQPSTSINAIVSTNNNNGFHFQISDNPAFNIVSYNNSNNFNVILPIIPITPSQVWRHLIVVYKSGESKIYENGIQIGLSNDLFSSIEILNNLFIGSGYLNQRFFNGKLDDIGIWNRALTTAEVTQLYNANQCFTNTTVTDTLVINVGQLSYTNPIFYANNITLYPNPASNQININFNTITDLTGGQIHIINSLGQQVATTPITLSGTNTTMPLTTWGGAGIYFVQIINPQGQIVDIKKIILQ